MPATSQAQQKLMGADLARKRAGKETRTGMSEIQLKDFASTKRKGLPKKAPKAAEGAVVALKDGACSATHNLIKAGFEEE